MSRNNHRILYEPKAKSVGRLVLIALLLLALGFLSGVLELGQMARQHLLDDLITIQFEGATPQEVAGQVRAAWLQPDGRVLPGGTAHYVPETNSWAMTAFYMGHLGVQVTAPVASRVRAVHIKAGSNRFDYAGAEPFAGWAKTQGYSEQKQSWITFEKFLPGHSFSSTDEIGWRLKIIQLCLARYVILLPLALVVIGLFVHYSQRKEFKSLVAALLLGPMRKQKASRLWFSGGLVVVACALAFLELTEPFYFTQGDNLLRFLPVIEQGAGALFKGTVATWNPYQFMGAPTLSLGAYALTYPLTYCAFALGALILPQAHVLIETFAALHIICGYLVFYLLARRSGVRPSLAAAAGFSLVLSGFFLIAGRFCYHLLPIALWAPLMVLLTNRLIAKPVGWPWTIATAAVIGVFYHAGNTHIWFYALLTCAVTVITALWTRLITVKRMLSALPALIIGLGLAAPLMVLQLGEGGIHRTADPITFAGVAWSNLFLPLGDLTTGWGQPLFPAAFSYPREVCYFGGIFAAAALFGSLFVISRALFYRSDGAVTAILRKNVWLPAALFALVLACGSEGIVWDVFSVVPAVGTRFAQPLHLIGYFALYALFSGALMIERWLTAARAGRRMELLLVIATAGLLCAHLLLANAGMYTLADKPYQPLPPVVSRLLTPTDEQQPAPRIFSCAPRLSASPTYYLSLAHNYPTAYKIFAVGGSDPVCESSAPYRNAMQLLTIKTAPALQIYGVRYLDLHQPEYSQPRFWSLEALDKEQNAIVSRVMDKTRRVTTLPQCAIFELPAPDPLAFVARAEAAPLKMSVSPDGVTVDISSVKKDEPVVINFLARPWFNCFVDGRQIPYGQDKYGRLVAIVHDTGASLSMRYVPPWGRAFAVALVLIVAGTALAFLSRWMRRKR